MYQSPKRSPKMLKKKISLRLDQIKTIINDQTRLPFLSAEKVQQSNKKNQVDGLSSKVDIILQSFNNLNINFKIKIHQTKNYFFGQLDKLKNRNQIMISKWYLQNQSKLKINLNQNIHNQQSFVLYQEKKSPRKKNIYRTQNKTINVLPPSTYLQQYGNMVSNLANLYKRNSQDTQNQIQQQKQIISNDILYYEQLKKRPKFLNYLKNRIMQSRNNTLNSTQVVVSNEQLVNSNQNLKQLQKQFEEAFKTIKNEGPAYNPQNIIRKQFQKLFSKTNDMYLINEMKERQFCKQILKKQQEISMKNLQLSEQNKKNLQQKFNKIVKTISKSDRSTQSKRSNSPAIHLPKISYQ